MNSVEFMLWTAKLLRDVVFNVFMHYLGAYERFADKIKFLSFRIKENISIINDGEKSEGNHNIPHYYMISFIIFY